MLPAATPRRPPTARRTCMKVVILMTDGAFNTAYCKGVIAQMDPSGSLTGSGSVFEPHQLQCAATAQDPFAQAAGALHGNMKAAPNNVIVYSVGFERGFRTPRPQANARQQLRHRRRPTSTSRPTTAPRCSVAFQADRLRPQPAQDLALAEIGISGDASRELDLAQALLEEFVGGD